ncbi:MAG: SDR family NAD(P)-dependent oxidoreductase [Burkholderiaceae bacterium]
MDGLLNEKVAIVTGASRERGIGLATAKLFAEHGAIVVLTDLDGDDARRAAGDVGVRHLGLACDVTDRDACVAVADDAIRRFGRIDVLVNNAGVTQRRGVMDVTPEDYALVTDVVLRGTLYMSQAVIPHMRAQRAGSIVCVSSMSGQQGGGVFGGTHYCAAKAGVIGMAKAMARELGPDGVRVNAIAPGLILTDFSRRPNSDAGKHELAKSFPLGRVGMPADVAGACLYLASDRLSGFVTGATLDVNGGANLR